MPQNSSIEDKTTNLLKLSKTSSEEVSDQANAGYKMVEFLRQAAWRFDLKFGSYVSNNRNFKAVGVHHILTDTMYLAFRYAGKFVIQHFV